jgi:TRADD-N domain-containing protein
MARQIAEQMLEQRMTQLERAGLYDPAKRPGPRDARIRRAYTYVGLTFPVRVITVAALLLGLVLTVGALFPGLSKEIVIAAAWIVPSGAIMAGFLTSHNRERRRHGAETGARLNRELHAFRGEPNPFPRDAALALRRAENLVAQADVELRLLTQRLLRNIALFCVLAIPALTVTGFQVFSEAQVQVITLGAIFEALMAVILGTSRQRIRTLESDLREADYERSLLTDNEDSEARAEKLFLKHQFELKRYYDETLRQSAMLSYLGVLCMAGGFVVIGVAFYLIAREEQPDTQQIMIATLAAAGGVLANFVAVLYLAMHARTVRALTGFHQRLVGTHHVHFGNLLASRVDDGQSSEVLAQMAVALASDRGDDRNGASDKDGKRRTFGEFVGDAVGAR